MKQMIDELKDDFAFWRRNKKNKCERIPSELLTKTLEIYKKFPNSNLKSILGLSNSTWSAILLLNENSQVNKKSTFIKLGVAEKSVEEKIPQLANEHGRAAIVMMINNVQITIYH